MEPSARSLPAGECDRQKPSTASAQRGAKSAAPGLPRVSVWELRCRRPGPRRRGVQARTPGFRMGRGLALGECLFLGRPGARLPSPSARFPGCSFCSDPHPRWWCLVKLPLPRLHRSDTPPPPDTCFPVSARLEHPTFPGTRLPVRCTTLNPTPPPEVDSQGAQGLSERESPVSLTALGKKTSKISGSRCVWA